MFFKASNLTFWSVQSTLLINDTYKRRTFFGQLKLCHHIDDQNDANILDVRNDAHILDVRNDANILDVRNDAHIVDVRNDANILDVRNDAHIVDVRNDAHIVDDQYDTKIFNDAARFLYCYYEHRFGKLPKICFINLILLLKVFHFYI